MTVVVMEGGAVTVVVMEGGAEWWWREVQSDSGCDGGRCRVTGCDGGRC